MPHHLRWKLAAVTGGGSGLGREIAVGLARLGVRVVVADRDREAAEEAAARVRAERVQAWAVQADLADEADVRLLAARLRDLGGADVLVNNAGGWTPGDEQFPDAPAEAWSRTLDLNLRTPMLLTQLFLDALPAPPAGDDAAAAAVVNVSSSAALGSEAYGSPEYAAAKAGLVRFTTALADPVTHQRARVMAVVPGWSGLERAVAQLEEMTPAEREGISLVPPERVVRAVVELVSSGHAGQVVEIL